MTTTQEMRDAFVDGMEFACGAMSGHRVRLFYPACFCGARHAGPVKRLLDRVGVWWRYPSLRKEDVT